MLSPPANATLVICASIEPSTAPGCARASVSSYRWQQHCRGLYWALDRFQRLETIGVDYGQRHRIQMECWRLVRRRVTELFPQWSSRLGDDQVLSIPVLAEISDTALTSEAAITLLGTGLPSTFVPGRNLLLPDPGRGGPRVAGEFAVS
jgi:7-cyano-7-deazaguanine synthase